MNPGEPDNGPDADHVRAELERIVSSARFSNNPSLTRFLRHTVEETLAGKPGTLKEYSIGLEVFHRGNSFDPRIDPIVRVQASKLRARLRQYYEQEGADSEVLIEYSKGTYVPSFRRRISPSHPALARRSHPRGGVFWLIAGVVIAAAGVLAVWRLMPRTEREALRPPMQVTANVGATIFPSISRDGRLLVYSSDRPGNGDLDLWVQPAAGGEAVRLTAAQGADITPDFSPDGTNVVFRSRRGAGGLHVVSVLGGAERRLTGFGWRPRYSPDGRFIVFSGESKRPGGDLFILPAGGGEARRIDIGDSVRLGGVPIWSRGGSHLVFSGYDERQRWDFWVVPREGGVPVSVGLADQLQRQGLGEVDQETVPGDWLMDDLVFSLVRDGIANIWRAPVSPSTLRISGPLRRITTGSAMELSPRVSGSGRIVFSSDHLITHLFAIPLGSPRAEPRRLTEDASLRPGHFRDPVRFSVGPRYLVYSSRRSRTPDILLRDLASGAESLLAATAESEENPLLSPDEHAVVYTAGQAVWLVEVESGVPRRLCTGCGTPISWHPDSRRILLRSGAVRRRAIHMLDVASPEGSIGWLADPEYSFRHAAISPDSNWIAVTAESVADAVAYLWLIPMEAGRPAARSRWVPAAGADPESALQWDRQSRRLYFFSSRDGSRCLWSLGWHRHRPGPLEEIRHWSGSRIRPWNSWLSIGGGRAVFELTDATSNIFLIEPSAGPSL